MKKHYLLFTFVFLFSISSFSQVERIDIGTWYLYGLTINSETIINPFDFTGNNVTTDFGLESDGTYTFNSWICDSTGGKLNYESENTSFTVSDAFATLGGCLTYISEGLNHDDIYSIDNKLINFFSNAGVFTYEIAAETSSTPKTVTITATNGDFSIYHNSLLSTWNNEFLSFSIYPNPVVDELSISSSRNLKNHKIEVFDLIGKLRFSKNITDSNTLNVRSLPKGMFVLLVKDDLGNMATKKFVKN